MLEVLRQASRELHELHGLRGVVHYEGGHDERRERQQLEKANDAPSAAPAI